MKMKFKKNIAEESKTFFDDTAPKPFRKTDNQGGYTLWLLRDNGRKDEMSQNHTEACLL